MTGFFVAYIFPFNSQEKEQCWAIIYTKRMLLEQGYGNNASEKWVTWYRWNLRITFNAILNYSVYMLEMIEKEALNMRHMIGSRTAEKIKIAVGSALSFLDLPPPDYPCWPGFNERNSQRIKSKLFRDCPLPR